MTQKTFLDKAYDVGDADGIQKLYADWAESYEAEVQANGYATPDRIAAALAKLTDDVSRPILDYGCGTGLSGNALYLKGFSNITGADPSPEMLAYAKTKSVYNHLVEIDVDVSLPFEIGEFSTIAAIGVIGAGAAPIEVFDELFNLLKPGQKFALSMNDHTLSVPEFPDRITSTVQSGNAKLLFEEFGDHLPGQNMSSMIYVIEKN